MSLPSRSGVIASVVSKAKEARDQLFVQHPLLDALYAARKASDPDAGVSVSLPILTDVHSVLVSGGQEGTTPLAVASRNPLTDATFNVAMLYSRVALTRKQELENKGPDARIKLLNALMSNTIEASMREVESYLFQYSAASQCAVEGLNTLDGLNFAGGFLEENAPAAQTNPVGGVARNANFWYNNIADVASNFNLNGISRINSLHVQAEPYSSSAFKRILFLSPAAFTLFLNDRGDQMRFYEKDKLESGRLEMVASNGYKVRQSVYLGYTVGPNTLSGVLLDLDSIRWLGRKDEFFAMDKTAIPSDTQLLQVWPLIIRGQLVADKLRSTGLLLNAEV